MRHTLYLGNAIDALRTLLDESVHCVVTSPPYWGLRDYGVPGQMGLEATPEEYVAKMVEVFREVRRVLRGDGVLWLNLGDSYAAGKARSNETCVNGGMRWQDGQSVLRSPALKPKDLVGIPWRVAFALQSDGWWLRSDIIWQKPNTMPESVTDRPTKSHEYIFLLTKSARYYYDAVAIQEPQVCPQDSTPEDLARAHNRRRQAQVEPRQVLIQPSALAKATFRREHAKHSEPNPGQSMAMFRPDRADTYPTGYRNKRDVWTVATQPFPGAHFAVFPEALAEPCILAGTSEKGCCPKCGAPWIREVEKQTHFEGHSAQAGRSAEDLLSSGKWRGNNRGKNIKMGPVVSTDILGWQPTCSCGLGPIPCTVLDPFGGSGTVSVVSRRLGRNSVYIDLNPNYADMAVKRLGAEQQELFEPCEVLMEVVS